MADYKFGFNPVTKCAENPQPTFFARVRALLDDAPEVEGRIFHVGPNGDVSIDRHVFGWFELETFGDSLRETRARVERARDILRAGEVPDVTPGPHCRYCPAAHGCSAQTSLAKSMLSELESIDRGVEAMTPAQAGQAWTRLKQFQTLADRVESGLKLLAKQHPLPLGNGKVLRPILVKRTSFDREAAVAVMRRHGASEEEIEACTVPAPREELRAMNAR